MFDRQALGAFFLYLALAFLFFGRGLVGHFSSWYLGRGADPPQSIWFLAWWAYAIIRNVNPFLTKPLFAPAGANLAWSTAMPLAGVIAFPVTWLWGPVVTYNVLGLLAPPLAGWAAFVLCRWITHGWWSSIAGGWVFGFSSYIVSAILTHLHDIFVFPVPLVVWIVLRRLNGELELRRFVAVLALLIGIQFTLCAEIAATATFTGAIAFILGLAFTEDKVRRSLLRLAPSVAAAYALAAAFLSPYLYYMFAFGHPAGVVLNPMYHGADIVSFLVPTAVNELGRPALLGEISRTYLATLTETGSYLALPLIAIAVAFAKANFGRSTGRILVEFTVIVSILTIGTRFVIAGHPTVAAPWLLFSKLPLVDKALPVRLMMYVSLALALMVAMWLRGGEVRLWLRCALGAALVPFMLPNLSSQYWKAPLQIPPFFSTGMYRQYLAPGRT